jgi:hypothetical protein
MVERHPEAGITTLTWRRAQGRRRYSWEASSLFGRPGARYASVGKPSEGWYIPGTLEVRVLPRPNGSSGRAYLGGRIVVTAGSEPQDQHLTLCHEIAHQVAGVDHWHDAAFWWAHWTLAQEEGLAGALLKEVLEHPHRVKGPALGVAQEMGIRGSRIKSAAKGRR